MFSLSPSFPFIRKVFNLLTYLRLKVNYGDRLTHFNFFATPKSFNGSLLPSFPFIRKVFNLLTYLTAQSQLRRQAHTFQPFRFAQRFQWFALSKKKSGYYHSLKYIIPLVSFSNHTVYTLLILAFKPCARSERPFFS